MSAANLSGLADRLSTISTKLFADIISNQDHKLLYLLPPLHKCTKNLQSSLNIVIYFIFNVIAYM